MSEFTSTQEDVQSALNYTQKIIDECGPRLVGESSTKHAAEIIKDEMNSITDDVHMDSFEVHPNAFLGWVRLLVVLSILSIFCIWLNIPLIAALLVTFGIIVMVLEFFYYKEFIDLFWKKKTGYNVYGIIEPDEEVKQQFIISGHHDSAYIFNFLYYQPNLYPIRLYGGLGSVFYLLIISWVWVLINLITENNTGLGFIRIVQFSTIFIAFFIVEMWWYRNKKGTPGAGDNMISSSIAIQFGKKIAGMKSKGNGLKHTRVIIGSWDAEEAGLRGARAFCKKNKQLLSDLPSYNFNMDCPYYKDEIFFMTSDINGTVKLSEEMADQCVAIAKDLGIPAITKPIAFLTGGTDAGEFAKVGVNATNLMAMPWGNSSRASVYHTPNDIVEAIEPEAVDACLKIALKYVEKLDSKF